MNELRKNHELAEKVDEIIRLYEVGMEESAEFRLRELGLPNEIIDRVLKHPELRRRQHIITVINNI